jgi:hypothetical protein
MHASEQSDWDDDSSTCTPTPATRLATFAVAGMVFYLVSGLALQFLRPDYSIVETAMSAYAVGQYGFVETIAFAFDGLAILALSAGLLMSVSAAGRSRAGLILLGLAGAGRILEALFPTDVPPGAVPRTPAGVVHIVVAFAVFVLVVVAALLISRRLGKDPGWQAYRRPAMPLAWASSATLGLFLLQSLVSRGAGHYFGLFEKIFLVSWHIWVLMTASQLRSIATRSGPA